jgi:hypothetical protein
MKEMLMLYFSQYQKRIVQEILIERNNQTKQPFTKSEDDDLLLDACGDVFSNSEKIADKNLKRKLLIKIATVAICGIEKMDGSGEC